MRYQWYKFGGIALALCISSTSWAATESYLTQSEYGDVLYNNYKEDRGIVVENCPQLGYMIYRNGKGREVTCNYYVGEVVVEKQPYYEAEDRIGYLDELFPNFEYDARDTSIESIKAGDCVYLRLNADGELVYVSADNDYIMRYGKVISYNYNSGDNVNMQLQDEKGNLYYYEISGDTPVTKGRKSCTLSSIKNGDWVKLLICQRILGEGIIDEAVMDIVVDNDTRIISNLYRGQITSLDTYKRLLNLKDVQALGKQTWGPYKGLVRLGIDTNTVSIYKGESRISPSYLNRYLVNSDNWTYIAAENYRGKEQIAKLSIQSPFQSTLPISKVISVAPTGIKLLSGETLNIFEDTIIIRENRLVDANSIMVGDPIKAVVSSGNKLAVGVISSEQTTGSLSIYRGRVKKVKDYETFQVETFSMLDQNLWYYHPTPQTFTINSKTKYYTAEGIVENGINDFLGYGEDSSVGKVYTIIANGEEASMIIDMPYVTESVKGEIYVAEDESVQLQNVYYYDQTYKKWIEYSKKNVGAKLAITPNSVVIKNGRSVPISELEVGDKISAMVDTNLKKGNGNITGYILVVEN